MGKAIAILCAILAACAAEPVPYHSGNDIPRGPGLLSGAEGEFVLRVGGAAPAPAMIIE